eukprot:5423657-Prymnesium_polylepis.1
MTDFTCVSGGTRPRSTSRLRAPKNAAVGSNPGGGIRPAPTAPSRPPAASRARAPSAAAPSGRAAGGFG